MMAVMKQFDFAIIGRCGDGGNKVIFLRLQNLGQSSSFNSHSPDCLKAVAKNCSGQRINCYRIQRKA